MQNLLRKCLSWLRRSAKWLSPQFYLESIKHQAETVYSLSGLSELFLRPQLSWYISDGSNGSWLPVWFSNWQCVVVSLGKTTLFHQSRAVVLGKPLVATKPGKRLTNKTQKRVLCVGAVRQNAWFTLINKWMRSVLLSVFNIQILICLIRQIILTSSVKQLLYFKLYCFCERILLF